MIIYPHPFKQPISQFHKFLIRRQIASLLCAYLLLYATLAPTATEAQVGINIFPFSSLELRSGLYVAQDYSFYANKNNELVTVLETASALYRAGNFSRALEFLKKATTASRIENGFYNETQIVLQKLMIENERALKNWSAVDDHYAHLEVIYRRLYSFDDEKLESGLSEISGWLSFSLYDLPLADRHKRMFRAYQILKKRLEIAETKLSTGRRKASLLSEKLSILERELYPIPVVNTSSNSSTRLIR
tara:strand:- start:179 stop:919 length:741 start_codon:yes stop_codon:yes gene_type:complete